MKVLNLEVHNIQRVSDISLDLDGHNLFVIGGKNGVGKCVPEGSLVAMWNGSRKKIEDVRETDTLVGLNPDTWRFQPEKPLQMMTNGVKEVFRLKTRRGREIVATKNHRILTEKGWMEIGELSIGDFVVVPMKLPCDTENNAMTPEECYLSGLLIGDGSLTRGMELTAADNGVRDRFFSLTKSVFPECTTATRQSKNIYHCVTAKSKKLGPHHKWMKKHDLRGKVSQTKSIPPSVFLSGIDGIKACIAGLMSTDGWYTTDGYGEFYSCSKALIDDAQALFLRAGIPTTKRVRHIQKYNNSEYWQISIVTKEGRDKFKSTILPLCCRESVKHPAVERAEGSSAYALPPIAASIFCKHHGNKLSPWVRGGRRVGRAKMLAALSTISGDIHPTLAKYMSEDIGFDIIKSIESEGMKQTFDLSMPSEAFVCNDFIVHNSSAIVALLMALQGRRAWDEYPEVPLKNGEDEALIRVQLSGEYETTHQTGGMTVELQLTRSARKGTVEEELRILDVDGDPAPEPRTLLKQLFNLRGFDPLAFERMKPKEQKVLMEQLLGLDFTEAREEYKRLYEKRTDVNRECDKYKKQLDGMPKHSDCVEVSVTDLIAELDKRTAHNDQNERLRQRLIGQETRLDSINDDISHLQHQIEELTRQLETKMTDRIEVSKHVEQLQSEAASLVDQDTAEIRKQIGNAEANNAKARENAKRQDIFNRWKELDTKSADLTKQMDAIEAANKKKLLEAEFPVEGMALDKEGILLNGLPFSQASTAERIKASVRIGMALNPTLRLMVSQDGGALDDETIKALDEILAEGDFQMIVEMPTRSAFDEDLCSVVIRDGKVAKTNPKKLTTV